MAIDRVVVDKATGNIEVFAVQSASPPRKKAPRKAKADPRQGDIEDAIAGEGGR